MGAIGLNTKGFVIGIRESKFIKFENLSLSLWCFKNYEMFTVDGSGCALH